MNTDSCGDEKDGEWLEVEFIPTAIEKGMRVLYGGKGVPVDGGDGGASDLVEWNVLQRPTTKQPDPPAPRRVVTERARPVDVKILPIRHSHVVLGISDTGSVTLHSVEPDAYHLVEADILSPKSAAALPRVRTVTEWPSWWPSEDGRQKTGDLHLGLRVHETYRGQDGVRLSARAEAKGDAADAGDDDVPTRRRRGAVAAGGGGDDGGDDDGDDGVGPRRRRPTKRKRKKDRDAEPPGLVDAPGDANANVWDDDDADTAGGVDEDGGDGDGSGDDDGDDDDGTTGATGVKKRSIRKKAAAAAAAADAAATAAAKRASLAELDASIVSDARDHKRDMGDVSDGDEGVESDDGGDGDADGQGDAHEELMLSHGPRRVYKRRRTATGTKTKSA